MATEAMGTPRTHRAALELAQPPFVASTGSKDRAAAAAAAAAASAFAVQPTGFSSSKIKFEGGRSGSEPEVQLPMGDYGRKESSQLPNMDNTLTAYDSALASSREERDAPWPVPADSWRPSYAPLHSAFQSSLLGSFPASSQGSFQGSHFGSSKFEASSQHGSARFEGGSQPGSSKFDVHRLLSNNTLRSDDDGAPQLSTPMSSWKSSVEQSSACALTSPKIKFESRRSAQSQDTPLNLPSSNNSSRKDYSDSYLPNCDTPSKRGGPSDDGTGVRLPIGAGRESIDQPTAKFKYEMRKHSTRQSICYDMYGVPVGSRRETGDDNRMSFEVGSWQAAHQPHALPKAPHLPILPAPSLPATHTTPGLTMAHEAHKMRKAADSAVDATIHVSVTAARSSSEGGTPSAQGLAKGPSPTPGSRAPGPRRVPQPPQPPSNDASGESDSGSVSPGPRPRPYGRPRNVDQQQQQQQQVPKPGDGVVGRGKSFPVMYPAGVLSAEPSGEWWSPATLRDRLRTSQGPAKPSSYPGTGPSESPAVESPIDEAKMAWRASPSITADLDKEASSNSISGERHGRGSGGGTAGLVALLTPAAPPTVSTHARPRRAISDPHVGNKQVPDQIANGGDSPNLSDSKLSPGFGRRESLLGKLSSMRVRRHARATMPMTGLEDVLESGPVLPKEPSSTSAGLSFYRGAPEAPSPSEPPSPDTPGLAPRTRLPQLVFEGGRR